MTSNIIAKEQRTDGLPGTFFASDVASGTMSLHIDAMHAMQYAIPVYTDSAY